METSNNIRVPFSTIVFDFGGAEPLINLSRNGICRFWWQLPMAEKIYEQ
jgi:hypothetical protein